MQIFNLSKNSRFRNQKKATVFFLFIFLTSLRAFSQNATTVNISGTNSAVTINNNTATVVDPGIVIIANGDITGFTVSITGSYTTGDELAVTGTLPSGISVASFNTATRSLVFSGTATPAQWQAIARNVTLRTTSAVCNPESRLVSFVVGIKYYNILNGHFYEYYATGQSWTNARAYASGLSYFGREGYLSTVTAQSENSFSYVLVGQNSWIGCSDNYLQINAAVGYTMYATQALSDGNFFWITGPERGTKISGANFWASGGIAPVSGVYNSWATNEPNDHPGHTTASPGQEDYGHMYTGSGLWNDFPNTSSIGSIIEFGGMPNDITTSQVVTTRSVYINGAPSGTIIGGNVSVCSGTNSTTLTLTGLTGSVTGWQSSLDNFLTAGVAIANTTTSLTVNNITTTTFYRAVVNSSSGCVGLQTSSTPIYVTGTVPGNIVASNNSICPGAQASFSLFGNTGSVVRWQVSTSSNFSTGVTNITNTTTSLNHTLSSTGTYYFRAVVQNNGCGSPVNTPGYTITVVSGTSPVGGTVSSADHCGGSSNGGTLTLSGHTGTVAKWQYSNDNGIIWIDVTNTSTSLTYSGLATNRLYRAQLSNGTCGTAFSTPGVVTVYGTTVCRWDGTTSTAWQTSSNWCGGVADNGKDIVISASASNHLVLDQNRIIGRINFNNSSRTIDIGNFNLTVSSLINYNSSSYIKAYGTGKLSVNIANGATTVFPIGCSSYTPLTITNNTGSADVLSVRVFQEVFIDGTSGFTASMGRVKRTWDISKATSNAGGGLNFIFNWNSGDVDNLLIPSLYHYENGNWNLQSGSASYTSTSLTYTGYTGTFSPFAIGNPSTPLPVSIMNFEAKPIVSNKTAVLNWETNAETQPIFEIERSIDGSNWEAIGNLAGSQNVSSINAYEYTDLQPNSVNYYRVKFIDNEGAISYSVIRKVDFNNPDNFIKVYPNPAGKFVNIISEEEATYTVTDASGRVVREGTVYGETQISELATGLYLIQVSINDKQYTIKLIVE